MKRSKRQKIIKRIKKIENRIQKSKNVVLIFAGIKF
jgi:hypothetical protein